MGIGKGIGMDMGIDIDMDMAVEAGDGPLIVADMVSMLGRNVDASITACLRSARQSAGLCHDEHRNQSNAD